MSKSTGRTDGGDDMAAARNPYEAQHGSPQTPDLDAAAPYLSST
mgnify:CR=1 FL=1